jgi:hypothetical protein
MLLMTSFSVGCGSSHKGTLHQNFRGAKVKQSVLAPINHLLRDLMTDLVIHTSYPVTKAHAQSHEDHRRILFTLNRIFESEQGIIVVGKTHSSKTDGSSVLMDRDTMR